MKTSIFMTCLMVAVILLSAPTGFAARFLWDASKEPMAGNADWVIDADSTYGHSGESDPQRFPSPSQSGVTGGTPETYWHGANSEWAIRLVKAGHSVETLPRGSAITYGDGSNPQDLSYYDVFILNEPQDPFTASEREALYAFIENGGGVLMIADHCLSDRNHNGWDSPKVFNDLQIADRLGVYFQNEYDCEFTQNVVNVHDDYSDPIIHGPFGNVGLIECHGAIEITLYPDINPTVQGRAWRNPYPQAYEHVIVATCEYGAGRVGFVNDSSLTDDGTGDPNDYLHDNFSVAENEDDVLLLNLSVWLAGQGSSQPTPTPSPTADPNVPTATPPPGGYILGVQLDLNATEFWAGDPFKLRALCSNPMTSQFADLYVILDIYGEYWYYPSWEQEPDSKRIYLPEMDTIEVVIFDFTWPEVDGSASGLRFWGAMLDSAGELLGRYDWVEWGYE